MEVKVWDAAGKERKAPPAFEGGAMSFEFTADSRHLTVLGRDGRIRSWDLAREVVETEGSLNAERLTSGMVAPGGRFAAGIRFDATAVGRMYEFKAMSVFPPKPTASITVSATIGTLYFSPDGSLLAFTAYERFEPGRPAANRLRLLEIAAGRERPLPANFPAVFGVPVFSPDGSLLAIVAEGRVLRLYETAGMKQRGWVEPAPSKLYTLAPPAFSRDGAWLAVAASDGIVRVYPIPPTGTDGSP
jgi:WD40 repeat protein